LRLFQLVQKARHLEHPLVHYTQAAAVTVTCEAPIAFHTEGELFYTEKMELTARVIPGRLDLIVPPSP